MKEQKKQTKQSTWEIKKWNVCLQQVPNLVDYLKQSENQVKYKKQSFSDFE